MLEILNEQTTLKGFLIIAVLVLSTVVVVIFKAWQADRKRFYKMSMDYIETMKSVFRKNLHHDN